VILQQSNDCPKCNSDTFVYQTVSGNQYEECFRCGYRNKLDSATKGEETVGEGSLGQAEGSARVR